MHLKRVLCCWNVESSEFNERFTWIITFSTEMWSTHIRIHQCYYKCAYFLTLKVLMDTVFWTPAMKTSHVDWKSIGITLEITLCWVYSSSQFAGITLYSNSKWPCSESFQIFDENEMCFVGLPHWKVMVCSSTTVGLMRSMTSLLWRYWMDKWFLNTPQVKIRVNLFVQKVEINPGQIYGSTM